jgi:hypothetical protein
MAAVSDGTVVLVIEHVTLAEKSGAKAISVHLSCSAPITFAFTSKTERDTFFDNLVTALKALP